MGLRVRAALPRGDGVDGGQRDGVFCLQQVPVGEGAFRRQLGGGEVAVAVLGTRGTKQSPMSGRRTPGRPTNREKHSDGLSN